MKKKRILNDIILIAILVLIPLALLWLGNSKDNADSDAMVSISVDGVSYKTLTLKEDTELTITTEAGTNHVVVSNGEVWVSDADCRDKVCVDHNPISKNGEQIVCLPHKIVIEIVNGGDSEIDTLSQ